MSKWKIVADAESPNKGKLRGTPYATVKETKGQGSKTYLYFSAAASEILRKVVGDSLCKVAESDGGFAFIPDMPGGKVAVSYYKSYSIIRCDAITDKLSVGDSMSVSENNIAGYTCVVIEKSGE